MLALSSTNAFLSQKTPTSILIEKQIEFILEAHWYLYGPFVVMYAHSSLISCGSLVGKIYSRPLLKPMLGEYRDIF